jgi:toxin ParE1/3/4
MSRLRWTQRAKRALLAIARFIAVDNPDAAVKWITTLRKRMKMAASMPRSGRKVPELRRDDVRELVVRKYSIVYRIADDGIVVLLVFESHRQFPEV